MYSLGLLIVELETSRRRLLEVFEVPDGKRTNGCRTPPIPDGPQSIGLLPRLQNPPFGPCRYRRTFFVSFNAKEQRQGINSLLYAWVAETLQSFLPQLANMGILFGELVGIETLESRLREAVVAARSRIAAPGQVCAWART